MPKRRRLTDYTSFIGSYMRARLRPGMTRAQRNQVMRDGAAAWRRAQRGQNPFPGIEVEVEVKPTGHADEQVACPGCSEPLLVDATMAGQVVACPACGAELEVEVA